MDYEFRDVDPELFREITKNQRDRARVEKKQMVMAGVKSPIDDNFSILEHGQKVWVKMAGGKPFTGKVRMAKAKDSYVVENDEIGVLTMDILRPGLKITSTKPMIFDIMTPNHRNVFLTKKDMELSEIAFMLEYIKRHKMSVGDILSKTHNLIEKYPEEFI